MIFVILLLAIILRLISLDQSLWLDEAINVLAAKNYSFLGMITEYAKGDFHPPGHFIILWIWTKIFGYSEIAVRMPSVIFGLLTICTVYLIGQKLHSKTSGLIAALFLAINPLHIYYSQEARMYAFAALAVCLNMLTFINLIKGDKDNLQNKGVYILSSILVLSSDYVAYLIFPAHLFFILISLVIASIWLPVFLNQLQIGLSVSASVPAWKEVVGSFGLKPLILTYVKFIIGRIDHPNNLAYGLLFIIPGLSFLYLIWRGIKTTSKTNKQLLLVWLLVPVMSALLISLIIPIYSYFRLLFILPAFVILVSLGILSFKSQLRNALFFLVILVEIISTSFYLFNPFFQREDWKGLVGYLREKTDSEILFESTGVISPFAYYSNNEIQATYPLIKFPAENPSDVLDLKFLLNNNKDVYLIDYLIDISDPKRLVRKSLLDLGYREVNIKNFNGVGFVYQFRK